jgi:ribosomal protein S27AE
MRLQHIDEAEKRKAEVRWCPRCQYYAVMIPHKKGWKCLRKGHVVKEASNDKR